MAAIRNPILPGFNPDPCICRAGNDYYIATSTFEWFPGVQIHHSRDLVHWRLLTRPLTRVSQLDMRGNPCSGGIWAPCLTYADGLFWLIYTDVKQLMGNYKDTHNYLVTAPAIEGPWSEPVYLNSSGFDPSLFHDVDGRKWLVNQKWDGRIRSRNRFDGIVLQEYSVQERRLTGPIRTVFAGTALKVTEGPHLYRRNGFYYLMTAEGGTGWGHAVTVARSRRIEGPYEVDPANPMLTARERPELRLQKAGHASFCETPGGETYLVHLASRPLQRGESRRCMLGRETCLQKCDWTAEGWLRLAAGGNAPLEETAAPALVPHPWPDEPVHDDFDTPALGIHFQSLRVPVEESWATLRARPGWLRLFGRESLNSRHAQSLVARRIQHFRCDAATRVEFAPNDYQQMAGLVAFYNVGNWYYLHVTHDPEHGRVLDLLACDNGKQSAAIETGIRLPAGPVELKVEVRDGMLQFRYATQGADWRAVGPALDGTTLSDDYVSGWGFTGAFVGVCCQDLSGRGLHADFDWFEYETREA